MGTKTSGAKLDVTGSGSISIRGTTSNTTGNGLLGDYQLTSIGAPAPNPYVAREVAGNRFKIAGGKISWQVTGICHDAYANANRIPLTEDKPPAEQGYYLHPEVYGQNESLRVGAGR